MQQFTSLIYKGEKYYIAQALELGVISQGKTPKEAQTNLKEAIELYLEDDETDIEPVSKPIIKTLTIAR